MLWEIYIVHHKLITHLREYIILTRSLLDKKKEYALFSDVMIKYVNIAFFAWIDRESRGGRTRQNLGVDFAMV